MDYNALKTEIETGPLSTTLAPMVLAGNDGGIADALNAETITVKGKVDTAYIRQYLMLVDMLIAIETAQTPTCIAVKRAMDIFPVFDLSDPTILWKFTQMLDGLVADMLVPAFTVEHKGTILSMADKMISRAEHVFGQSVSVTDIAMSLRNDDGSPK